VHFIVITLPPLLPDKTRVWGHDVRQQLFILKKHFAAEDNVYFGAENQIAGEKKFG
jgi:hypothetical protein